jgi:serine protease Do
MNHSILRTLACCALLGLAGVGGAQAQPAAAAAALPDFTGIVQNNAPAVVHVEAKYTGERQQQVPQSMRGRMMPGPNDPGAEMLRRFFGMPMMPSPEEQRHTSLGSGFIISRDGYILTNNHVVDHADKVTVRLQDRRTLTAKVVGTDPTYDIALLKIDAGDDLPAVKIGDSRNLKPGQWVLAIGSPFGFDYTVTQGIVSAVGRNLGQRDQPYTSFIQTDVPINRGNSGGPTFNLNGEVIGINTAIFSPSGGNVGIAFAIPASTARTVINDLIKDGSVERGWLGVQIQPVTDDIAESLGLSEAKGALVTQPQDGAPAAKAGIEAGDVVTAVNGDAVKDPRELAKKIAAMDPGKSVDITIWRNGKSESVKVELGELPTDMASLSPDEDNAPSAPQAEATLDSFGLTVVPAETGSGLVITSVEPDSVADERGLRAGDLILGVNNQDVSKASDVVAIIDAAAKDGRKAALFHVENDNRSRFVALPIEQG